ncbi:MAG: hypothetical protein ACD_83C00286G0003, partial [uncultured bacterium]
GFPANGKSYFSTIFGTRVVTEYDGVAVRWAVILISCPLVDRWHRLSTSRVSTLITKKQTSTKRLFVIPQLLLENCSDVQVSKIILSGQP